MLILIDTVPSYFALDQSKNPLDIRASLTKGEYVMGRVNRAELSVANRKILADVQAQSADLDRIFAGSTQVGDLLQATRFDIRRDALLLANRAKKLLGAKELNLERISGLCTGYNALFVHESLLN